jgi:outer membrane protein TolC
MMNRAIVSLFSLSVLVIFSSRGWSQTLTLQNAIDIALEKSYDSKRLKLELLQAEENLVAAKGRFRTHVDMSLDVPRWQENVTEIMVPGQLPQFNTTGTLRYMGSLDITQPLPTDGRLVLSSRAYHREVSTYLTQANREQQRSEMYTNLTLRYTQPIFAINQLKLGLKNANLSYDRTEQRYKRSQLNVVYLVTQYFFNLYQASRQEQIARDNVEQQTELYELAKKKFNAGLIPEVEALQMEVDLAEAQNELLSAQARTMRMGDAFKQLIGLQLSDSIAIKTDLEREKINVDLQEAIDKALNYRTEIREAEIDLELAKIAIKEADARSEIRGDLTVFYDLTGISNPNLPFGTPWDELWNSSLDDMERRPNNRGVIFTLSVPIWDWGVNNAEVAAARAAMKNDILAFEEQEKTIVREVREVIRRLREAENKLDVLTQNQTVAQRAFEISVERFNNGDITSQDLALDRNRFVQAKTLYLNAYIDFKLAIADLKRKTMYDWQHNISLVDD